VAHKKAAIDPGMVEAYPDGSVLLAKFLKVMPPASRWKGADLQTMRIEFDFTKSKFLDGLRGGKGTNKVLAQRPDITINEAQEFSQGMRRHLRIIHAEADRMFGQMMTRLQNPKTRDGFREHLDSWHERCRDLSDIEAGLILKSLLVDASIEVPSDGLSRGLQIAYERQQFIQKTATDLPSTAGALRTKHGEDSFEASWTSTLMPVAIAEAKEQLFPVPDLAEKTIQEMVRYSKRIGDIESDLLGYIMALFSERAKYPDDKVPLHINDVMKALGYKPALHGGFGAADKQSVRDKIEGLQDNHLTVQGAYIRRGKGKTRIDSWQSRVFVIWDRRGQSDLDGVIRTWDEIVFGMGRAWSAPLFTYAGRITASMHLDALKYDPRRERYEKRLLKRLSYFWRLNLNEKRDRREATVAHWLKEEIGEGVVSIVREKAERLEQAFERLKADGHIAAWGYEDGLAHIRGTVTLPRSWADKWVERKIFVDAPLFLVEGLTTKRALNHKPATAQTADTVQARQPDSLADQITVTRKALNISQQELGRILGIDHSLVSRIESGRRKPTEVLKVKLINWLSDRTKEPQ
jgi:DNA-binding transcriptional regulator YiaG